MDGRHKFVIAKVGCRCACALRPQAPLLLELRTSPDCLQLCEAYQLRPETVEAAVQ